MAILGKYTQRVVGEMTDDELKAGELLSWSTGCAKPTTAACSTLWSLSTGGCSEGNPPGIDFYELMIVISHMSQQLSVLGTSDDSASWVITQALMCAMSRAGGVPLYLLVIADQVAEHSR